MFELYTIHKTRYLPDLFINCKVNGIVTFLSCLRPLIYPLHLCLSFISIASLTPVSTSKILFFYACALTLIVETAVGQTLVGHTLVRKTLVGQLLVRQLMVRQLSVGQMLIRHTWADTHGQTNIEWTYLCQGRTKVGQLLVRQIYLG